MGSEGFEAGGVWGICPRCGAKKRLRTFRFEKLTKLRVCPECFDPFPIQELVRSRPDRQSVPNPAPEPADEFGTVGGFAAEAGGVFTRMTSYPVPARQTLINAFVVALGDVWIKLETLHILAAHDAQAARCNWIADTFALTEIGTLTFTADRGYAGDGTSSYLRGIPVSGWTKFTQDSASMLVWSRTTAADVATQTEAGISLAGVVPTVLVRVRNAFDTLVTRANDGTSTPVAVTTGLGLFGFSRRSATAYDQIVAGAVLASPAVPSTAPPIGNLNICGLLGNAFSARSIAAVVVGSGLTASEITTINTALTTYLVAVGAA